MSPVLLLLLVASGTFAKVTHCVGDSARPVTVPTEPTVREDEASSDHVREVPDEPITAGESVSGSPRAVPVKRVCMLRVNCAGGSHDNYEEAHFFMQPQRDVQFEKMQSTEETATANASTDDTPKPTRPPVPCSFEVQEWVKYDGHCVRLGQLYGGCRGGPYLMVMHPPCHPPPED